MHARKGQELFMATESSKCKNVKHQSNFMATLWTNSYWLTEPKLNWIPTLGKKRWKILHWKELTEAEQETQLPMCIYYLFKKKKKEENFFYNCTVLLITIWKNNRGKIQRGKRKSSLWEICVQSLRKRIFVVKYLSALDKEKNLILKIIVMINPYKEQISYLANLKKEIINVPLL